ncbi:hypothetical protein [Arthrobacter sp. B0490]|uniref:hypothetical protein n=1 Tax=Arthrobacter sp. B0490 TaxID=2058891 RepID=UPI002157370A|nr:hypothetical protein [Arthrobacter sp. B0490]
MHYPEPIGRHGAGLLLYTAVAALAAAVQLVAGYFYLVSGLAAPLWAVALLLGWWLVLTCVGVRLAFRRSYWLLLVPVVAVVTWWGAMVIGGSVLGWRA